MRRMLLFVVAVLVVVGAGVLIESFTVDHAPADQPVLEADGLGTVHFGLPEHRAVAALEHYFGAPTSSESSSGCGPRFSETSWSDFVAEFHLGVFTGYRYMKGGLETLSGSPNSLSLARWPTPALSTREGITLGSTLGAVRRVEPNLHPSGTNRWQEGSGLVFYDDAETFPDPPSSLIVEMKVGTCGDY